MKKTTLLLTCLILFAGIMQAQEIKSSSQGNELLNRLHQIQDYGGSVSDYFTAEEQIILRNHLSVNRNSANINNARTVELPAAYYNNSATTMSENAGVDTNGERNTNVMVPFTGTYYNNMAPNALIYDNGPYFNVAGSPDLSVLESVTLGMGTFGPSAALVNGYSVADDVVFADDLEVTSIDVFAYQTGEIAPSITGVYLQVYDGDPSSGASVVWGDMTTNILDDAVYADANRVLEDDQSATNRQINRVTANTAGLNLTAGTYWIEYSFEGSGSSGPWAPPITILGQATTGNALQNQGGGLWVALEDDGTLTPQGLPFVVYGSVGGSSGGDAYAIENSTTMFGKFDTTDPSVFNSIGASGVNVNNFENAGAVSPSDPNMVYVLDNANNFFTVNATTGAYTSMGTITAPGGEGWIGLEFDTTDGTLYGLSGVVNASSTLSVIDPVAMTATPIGGAGAAGVLGAISLAIDGSGVIYTHDIVDDAIFTIDKSTGVGSYLGDTGFDANFGQGMGYDQATATIFLTAFNNTIFDTELRTLDPTTGATTPVGQMEPGGLTQYGWVSFESSVVIGVGENTLEGFFFYPNPTTSMISLKSVNNIDSVSIYNLLGQQLFSNTVDAISTDISLSELATGTYIMKVSVDGQIGTYKVLKN